MDGVARKFPGRIQEARCPGALLSNRQSSSQVPGGVKSVVVPAGSRVQKAVSGSSAGEVNDAQTPAPQDVQPVDIVSASASAPVPSMPWMGLVLPAVTSNIPVAVTALKSADIIAVPTDTLYGIACDARCPLAVERIYEIKGRDASKPLPICVADPSDVGQYAEVHHLPPGLLEALFPGPVTLVLPHAQSSGLAPSLLSGSDTVGIRVPDAMFIRAVAREFGGPMALTSANESGAASSVRVGEFQSIWEKCTCILDGGTIASCSRLGSTVVQLLPGVTSGAPNLCTFRILRPGSAEAVTMECLKSFGVLPLE